MKGVCKNLGGYVVRRTLVRMNYDSSLLIHIRRVNKVFDTVAFVYVGGNNWLCFCCNYHVQVKAWVIVSIE